MKRIVLVFLLVLGFLGCGGSSNDEVQKLKQENEQLRVELEACRNNLKKIPSSSAISRPVDPLQRRNHDRDRSQAEPSGPRGSKHVSWYPNGQVKDEVEINTDENWHGLYVSYFENGQKKEEGQYKDGKKHGKWTRWDEKGKVLEAAEFVDGEKK